MLIVGDKDLVFNGINSISYVMLSMRELMKELPKTEPFSVEKDPVLWLNSCYVA